VASFTVTWDAAYEADPADTDLANLLGDDVRDLKRDIRERIAIDHSIAGDGDDGKHKTIQIIERVGDPTLDANSGGVYTKDVSTITELFWKDSAGSVKQLTAAGEINLFRSGAGTPVALTETGDFIGQRFYDTANVGWWTCTATGSPGTWAADIEPKTLRLLNDTTVPAGWLLCDGTASTPDLRGRFIVGYNAADVDYDALGVNDDFGEKKHILLSGELAVHSHIEQRLSAGSTGSVLHNLGSQSLWTTTPIPFEGNVPTADTGNDDPHENRPPYSAQMWIIKKPVA